VEPVCIHRSRNRSSQRVMQRILCAKLVDASIIIMGPYLNGQRSKYAWKRSRSQTYGAGILLFTVSRTELRYYHIYSRNFCHHIFRTHIFQAFLEVFPPYFSAFNFASWHGNPFILQKLAVCHFFCPPGMWDFSCSHQNVRPIL
jgi:hypothetical protein